MKSIIKKITVSMLAGIMFLYANTAIAANSNDYTAEQNKKNENNALITEIKARETEVEKIKDETLKEVEKLNIQITQYENQIEGLNTKIEAANEKISEAEENLKKSQEDYEKQEKALEARLVALYEAGETSYLDFILSSESLTDLISNYYLAAEIATYDTELLDSIEKEKEKIEKAKEELEEGKKELVTQKASKQSVATQLSASKANKDKYVNQLNDEEKQLQNKLEELKKANESLDAQIKAKQAAIAAALKKQQEESTKSSSSGSSSNSGSGSAPVSKSAAGFIRPVNSYVTTGLYYSSGGYHGAVDFGASGVNGMPVYAVADGVVVTTNAWTTSYGNHVIIAHSSGLYTLYAHGQMGSICVSEGQAVKQGQQIMRVGSTGNSTGPHLHFEVRTSPGTYSCRVNPLAYLP